MRRRSFLLPAGVNVSLAAATALWASASGHCQRDRARRHRVADAARDVDAVTRPPPRVSNGRFCWLAALVASTLLTASAAGSPSPNTGEQRYHREPPPGTASALEARFAPAHIDILEALNRADASHLPRLPELIVPDTWHDDVVGYSPFPARLDTWGVDEPKLLIVHQPGQAFAAYEHGRLIRWGPVSSGREISPTPHGRFHLNWRSTGRHSTVNPRWFMPWYFNFHNTRGLSLHEYVLPGRPASHACIRLLERDARWLYDWGRTWTLDARGQTVMEPGTPLQIVGCYAFGSAPPWRSLDWLANGIALPKTPLMEQRTCVTD